MHVTVAVYRVPKIKLRIQNLILCLISERIVDAYGIMDDQDEEQKKVCDFS